MLPRDHFVSKFLGDEDDAQNISHNLDDVYDDFSVKRKLMTTTFVVVILIFCENNTNYDYHIYYGNWDDKFALIISLYC
jgi:hypothetical protein